MIRGCTKCEIGELFILDQGCKGTRGHSAKLYKVRSNKEVMKHFFSRKVMERWNNLEQHVMRWIYSVFKINWIKFEKQGCFFYRSPLNPISLTCGLITVEATQGKESGEKRSCNRSRFRFQRNCFCFTFIRYADNLTDIHQKIDMLAYVSIYLHEKLYKSDGYYPHCPHNHVCVNAHPLMCLYMRCYCSFR